MSVCFGRADTELVSFVWLAADEDGPGLSAALPEPARGRRTGAGSRRCGCICPYPPRTRLAIVRWRWYEIPA
jgi:hypothetical protein